MARAAVGATLCAMLAAVALPAVAQDRIDKPVRLLVGFPPVGTGMDPTTGTPEDFGRIVASDYAR